MGWEELNHEVMAPRGRPVQYFFIDSGSFGTRKNYLSEDRDAAISQKNGDTIFYFTYAIAPFFSLYKKKNTHL